MGPIEHRVRPGGFTREMCLGDLWRDSVKCVPVTLRLAFTYAALPFTVYNYLVSESLYSTASKTRRNEIRVPITFLPVLPPLSLIFPLFYNSHLALSDNKAINGGKGKTSELCRASHGAPRFCAFNPSSPLT